MMFHLYSDVLHSTLQLYVDKEFLKHAYLCSVGKKNAVYASWSDGVASSLMLGSAAALCLRASSE